MRLQSLKRLVQVVRAMARPKRVVVLGSASLLASAPELGEPGKPLDLTFDADILVEPCDEGLASVLREAIGEGSLYHREFGVCADLIRPSIVETFPAGWRRRCVPLGKDVICLYPADLAFVKLCVGREKDRVLIKELIAADIVTIEQIRSLYQDADLYEKTLFKAGRLLRSIEIECSRRGRKKRAAGHKKQERI